MFGMGMGELVVIAIVALLFLGPDKIPEAAKAIGKGMRELRKQTRAVQETLEQDNELGKTVREIKSALRGDEPRPSIKPPAQVGLGRQPPLPGPPPAAGAPADPAAAPSAPGAAPGAEPTAEPAAPAASTPAAPVPPERNEA